MTVLNQAQKDTTAMHKLLKKPRNIYWYLPNIICYIRAMLILIPLATALTRPILTLVVCFVSVSLDVADGAVARYFNQVSHLGQALDYAIDRASLAVITTMLMILIPDYWWCFSLILILDLSSHIAHLYHTVYSQQTHHKVTSKKQNRLIRAYYSNRLVLFFACASHDLLLGAIYIDHFFHASWTIACMIIFIPGFVFKTIIHVLQIIESMQAAVANDCKSPIQL